MPDRMNRGVNAMESIVNTISSNSAARISVLEPKRVAKKSDTAASDQTTASPSTSQPPLKDPPEAVKAVIQPGSRAKIPQYQNQKEQEPTSKNPPRSNTAEPSTLKRYEFVHDDQSGLSVVKIMDSKGNVIMQVPPEQFLKMMQMRHEFSGADLPANSANTDNAKVTGLLLNKKV